jgi:ketosteroid isomerase-like protein
MNHGSVRALYAALGAGDRNAVAAILHDDFVATFADGLSFGIGGTHHGLDAIDHGWWAIARNFAIRAEPREWVDCVDGRLLVLGRYTGRARATKLPVEAAYAHLFSERDGRLAALVQFTDTAAWRAAVEALS